MEAMNRNAYRTLSDGVAMNEAVKAALRKVNLDETLIVVTGDHSHTLTISGLCQTGQPDPGHLNRRRRRAALWHRR